MAESGDLNFARGDARFLTPDCAPHSEGSPYRPTLYIGLGGTGAQAVAKLRRQLLDLMASRAGENREAGDVGIDPRYEFLAFDADASACPPELAKNRDWFHLGIQNLDRFYAGMGSSPLFNEWVVPGYPAAPIMHGAAGSRNVGRMVFMCNVDQVQRALKEKLQNITDAAGSPGTVHHRPLVYVFCSISGGAGAERY